MSATRRRREQLMDFVVLHGSDLLSALDRLADYYDEEAHINGPLDDCDDNCAQCDDVIQADSFRQVRAELKQLLDRV
ncbi:hypothetical protein [Nocardia terpenica]|uniref:Uncharacterized protein n=1 Tax=Nocardia terpenica TaxID=455432 RepID=A0A164LCA9_9NOCA|nr:hypothetical protein [Nocardia terpenica]KZM72250.1 hypothetical protein AWN90_36865 [Nocardia terpenica]NQE86604.1 hypothetical protein [Nocardia terpenica]